MTIEDEAFWKKVAASQALMIKELETMTEGYRYRGVENKLWKRIESLTNKLEVLTKCTCTYCEKLAGDDYSKCRGCKNTVLLKDFERKNTEVGE